MTETVSVVDVEAVTSLATSWKKTRTALHQGRSGTEPETLHDQPTQVGRVNLSGNHEGTGPRYHILARRTLVQLIRRWEVFPDRPLGLVAATSKGGMGTLDVRTTVGLRNPGIWAGQLSTAFPEVARVSSPNSACATGLSGLIQAARWIRHGEVDHAVVVASESCFEPLLTAGYRNMKALCGEQGMRPFHPQRNGFALAEGAGAVYLWGDELAGSHPDHVMGSIKGWGESNDAHHVTDLHPGGRGLRESVNKSLRQAGCSQADVDVLHAHLTTTRGNDEVEQQFLSNWPGSPVVQGVKPALGHSVGASGLIEAIATLDVLVEEKPFPIARYDGPLQPPDQLRGSAPRLGLTWNMGFGGHHASVLIEG